MPEKEDQPCRCCDAPPDTPDSSVDINEGPRRWVSYAQHKRDIATAVVKLQMSSFEHRFGKSKHPVLFLYVLSKEAGGTGQPRILLANQAARDLFFPGNARIELEINPEIFRMQSPNAKRRWRKMMGDVRRGKESSGNFIFYPNWEESQTSLNRLNARHFHATVEPGIFTEDTRYANLILTEETHARREAYTDDLYESEARSKRYAADAIQTLIEHNEDHTIVMLDIDHFKLVNEAFGHGNGDLCLAVIANRLVRRCRSTDHVTRFGGDEFFIIIPHGHNGLESEEQISARISELKLHASEPIALDAEIAPTEEALFDCLRNQMILSQNGLHFVISLTISAGIKRFTATDWGKHPNQIRIVNKLSALMMEQKRLSKKRKTQNPS